MIENDDLLEKCKKIKRKILIESLSIMKTF